MKVSYMFIAIAMICFTLLYIVNGEKVEEIRPRGGKGRRGGRGNTGGMYPKMVTGLKSYYITDVACGMSHNVAVSEVGEAYSWGRNAQGQLGTGVSSDEPVDTPVIIPVLIGRKVMHVSCGAGHSVVTTLNDGTFSWGIGMQGQLGHGDMKNKAFPVQIEKLANKLDINSGLEHLGKKTKENKLILSSEELSLISKYNKFDLKLFEFFKNNLKN